MPKVNNSKNSTPPQIPFLKNSLFFETLKKKPTAFECRAALSELKDTPPNLRVKKTTKVPKLSWAALGLGMAAIPAISLDVNNAGPALIALLGVIIKAVSTTNINQMQNMRINEYIKALEVFMSNCNTHVSEADRARIQAQINSVNKLTAISYAKYLKDPKGQKTRGQSSAPNTSPIPAVHVRTAQKTKPVVASASPRIHLPPSGFQLPNFSFGVSNQTINDINSGLGNAVKIGITGLVLLGEAVGALSR